MKHKKNLHIYKCIMNVQDIVCMVQIWGKYGVDFNNSVIRETV